MEHHDLSAAIGVQIGGTFDIAVTRQHIRKLAEQLQWSSMLRLRAIAALTALAETVFFRDSARREPLVVYIHVIQREGTYGIEYHADARFAAICKQFPIARWQLEHVSDELEIESQGDHDHIILRVWAKERS